MRLDVEKLNFYQTAEPFAYYSHTRKHLRYMLILENKDTFLQYAPPFS